jgi:hypothetical protein
VLPGWSLLPSVRNFVVDCGDDLASGVSVVLVTSRTQVVDDLWDAIGSDQTRRGMAVTSMDLAAGDYPANTIGLTEGLGLEWPDSTTPRTLSSAIGLPDWPEVLFLEGLWHLPTTEQAQWVSFIGEWARESKLKADAGAPPTAVLCAISASETCIESLAPDLYLRVRWFWGSPDVLETCLISRQLAAARGRGRDSRYKEIVFPSFSCCDLSLLEVLWDLPRVDQSSVSVALVDYAEQRGWADLRSTVDGLQRDIKFSSPTPDHLRDSLLEAWAEGILWWTPEFGLEIHVAATAVMADKRVLVERLWRGQVAGFMPLLEGLRIDICQYLSENVGENWPLLWAEPESEREKQALLSDPLTCGWGYLTFLMKTQRGLRAICDLRALCRVAHGMRNSLAHYHSVEPSAFDALLTETRFARGMGIPIRSSI